VDLKRLLKRGAILAAANWPVVVIQFAAQMTFQMLLAVPIVAAAFLVATRLGGDLADLLRGDLRDMFAAVAGALLSEPAALTAFVAAFALVLIVGSMFMFLVKGGTVSVLVAANDEAGPLEREPLTGDALWLASRFTARRFASGSMRLFRRYVALGLALMTVYAASAAAYLGFVLFGYRAAGGGAAEVGWTLIALLAAVGLIVWIMIVNVVYLLVQVAVASDDARLVDAARGVARFVRAELRTLSGIFAVVLAAVVAATLASALAWSGLGLIAFVPLVGLVVFPLQLMALLLRGLVFQYLGLTALGAYVAMYRRAGQPAVIAGSDRFRSGWRTAGGGG
jgi:hypothetical protein